MCKKIRILILVFIQLSVGCTVQNSQRKIDSIDMIDIVIVFKKTRNTIILNVFCEILDIIYKTLYIIVKY